VPLGPVYSFIDEHLELSSPYRGLNTGLTGRIAVWRSVLDVLKDGSWLGGNGLRSTDQIAYDINTVDNGYLVLLYEAGVIPAIGICLLYFTHTGRVVRNYLHSRDEGDSRALIGLVLVTVAFFTNNLTARYLFGMGNPYSLMMLVFLAAPVEPLRAMHSRVVGTVPLWPTGTGAEHKKHKEEHKRHKIHPAG
jgi:O-antigen ligase